MSLESWSLKLILVGSASLGGLAALLVVKQFSPKKRYNYPNEINWSHPKLKTIDQNGVSEELLLALAQIYPQECCWVLKSKESVDNNNWTNRIASFVSIAGRKEPKRVIILNSIESVMQFSANLTNIPNRPKNILFRAFSKGFIGLFFRPSSDQLYEMRKESSSIMHKLIESANFESNLMDEIQLFYDFLEKNANSQNVTFLPDASIYLQQITANMMLTMILGTRFFYDNCSDSAGKQLIINLSHLFNKIDVIQMDEFYQHEHDGPDLLKCINAPLYAVYDFLNKTIMSYRSNQYDSQQVNTYLDYLIRNQTDKLAKQKFIDDLDNYSDRDILVQNFYLLVAGAVNTGNTLAWAVYYLSTHQDVQNRVYEEICKNVDTSCLIHPNELANLPYLNAVVNETLRLASTMALIPRSTQHDVQVQSYHIRKNTTVLINLYALHRDQRYWDSDVNEFRVERWLSKTNKESGVVSFLPFGLAPRACLGSNLAKTYLRSIIANLIKQFELRQDVSQSYQSPRIGIVRGPTQFGVQFIRRK